MTQRVDLGVVRASLSKKVQTDDMCAANLQKYGIVEQGPGSGSHERCHLTSSLVRRELKRVRERG